MMKVESFPNENKCVASSDSKEQQTKSFEQFLRSPAGQMSGSQYHLTQLDQLEQSDLDFQTKEKFSHDRISEKNNSNTSINHPHKIDKNSDLAVKDSHYPWHELKITIEKTQLASTKESSLPSTFLLLKKQIQAMPALINETKSLHEKDKKQPQPLSTSINYTAKIYHQKYQLYLQKDRIELSMNCADLSKQDVIKFIANLKSTLQKQGLRLALLMINGEKQ